MTAENQKVCLDLWNEYEPQLRRICNIKLKSCPNEIDDVISDVYLVLCKKVSTSGSPDNAKAWLYGTLRNVINMKYREIYANKENLKSLSDIELELPFKDILIDEKIDEIYLNHIMDQLKTLLNKDEYRLVQYIYFDRKKMKEIAQIENSTEAAIKQKHYRICNKLRSLAKKLET